jgi:hypothetical protein
MRVPPMSDESGFEVDEQQLVGLVKELGVGDVVDAFPADLLAPTWRTLLKAGVVTGPQDVDVSRVIVRRLGSHKLELLVPQRLKDGDEVVKSVVVRVDQWTASGELGNQLYDEAKVLTRALESAHQQDIFDHEGPGQKPHN